MWFKMKIDFKVAIFICGILVFFYALVFAEQNNSLSDNNDFIGIINSISAPISYKTPRWHL